MEENKSNEQIHYESITNYFKYLVGITATAITILAGVAIFFTFNNISELRNEVKNNSVEIKEEITRNLKGVENEIGEVKSSAVSTIETIQRQANNEIESFKNKIQTNVTDETKSRVDQAFEENSIRELVEKTAEEKLREQLDEIVKEQVQRSQENLEKQMKFVPIIILAVDKVRWGDRAGVEILDSLRNFENDPVIREQANKIYLEKMNDYNEVYKTFWKDHSLKNMVKNLEIKSEINEGDTLAFMKELSIIVKESREIDRVVHAILAINLLTEQEIKVFDFQRAALVCDSYVQNKQRK